MISLEIQNELNALAAQFGSDLMRQVQTALAKYKRSGELVESVKLTIIKATNKTSPTIIITYADQGYFIGQKSPTWSKMPSIDALEEWGKSVQFTGAVPGYKNGLAPNLPPWKIKQRQLWAIAKAKQKFDLHRPKRWKKAARIGDLLKDLNQSTLESFNRQVENILNKALEGRA